MAQATGFYCDECKTFEASQGAHRPKGWLQLNIMAAERTEGFDICSNGCLLKLAKKRDAADREVAKLAAEAARMDAMRNAVEVPIPESSSTDGRRLWMSHLSNHRQKDTVDPDCKFCDRETAENGVKS